jgi:hypothetical protein
MEESEYKDKISDKLVGVLLISLFTVVMWGGVQIITVLTKETEAPETDKYVQPLPTTYDEAVLQELEERQDNTIGIPETTTE